MKPRREDPRLALRVISACPGCHSLQLTGDLCVLRDRTFRNGRRLFITARGCLDCGLVFASHFPTPEALQKTYSPEGRWGRKPAVRERHAGLSPAAVKLVQAVRDFGGPVREPATVLDVGCGVGHVLDAFAHHGYATVGIEPSTDVAFAVHERRDDLPSTPTYDVVVLNHVIEHLDAPFEMLSGAATAVRPGGVLLIGWPNIDALPQHGNLRYVLNGGHHLCAFSLACLKTWLRRHGFGAFQILERRESSERIHLLAKKVPGDAATDDIRAVFDMLTASRARPS